MNEPTDLERIDAKLSSINSKLDCILSELSGLKLRMDLDELINRLQSSVRSMREGNSVEE